MALALALMLLASDDDPWAEPPPRPVLAPADVQQRWVALEHRATAARFFDGAAAVTAVLGLFVLVELVSMLTVHQEVFTAIYGNHAGPPPRIDLSPKDTAFVLAGGLGTLAVASLFALVGGLLGLGLDGQRVELGRIETGPRG